ncbi:SatD family protein [Demequina lignilytica]|uniref:SatD family protein n=1 Tax=Demequina lignilytica TaxID=3051663 RepID=A0AAW7M7E0_9MICO|nr:MULTISPECIES: SatD family protein [unclassified Demequina]MDN4478528.1 SatD family protein [Demequina sp. SYSU T00039-1]MDN4482314.1 SatD family protein [Demequina sp. SYSU T0a273]MDN4486965.1 SatD family protein [Demequina sp. SYSU T00039]MDN4489649.1 SatD family protein [Demequina sp. SYSU T00068]
MDAVAAVIVDIVRSRELRDRAAAQDAVLAAFARAEAAAEVLRPLRATVGDEFQSVYATPADAIRVTALAALVLPDGVEVRAGIGLGEVVDVDGDISDGSAWWRARDAIEEAHRREDAGEGSVRSWCVGGDGEDVSMTVAVLLLRDHVLDRMKARERRIAAALLEGDTQSAIASRESISQAAVSQAAHRSGAVALREALDGLTGGVA